ncbi:adenosine deaminase 2-like [Cotesia typhae]|uniref:adenosine deaminase 2-like n=1 Tax=Cotesia typhae TaxID=2053667 RepID=UPI003D697472
MSVMNKFIESIIFLLGLINLIKATPVADNGDYWNKRAAILSAEKNNFIGSNLLLSSDELLANEVLGNFKKEEIDQAFEDQTKFYPARNFIQVQSKIEKSKVFRVIKMMPKGAVLHTHDLSLVSENWLYNNVTYRDNLYICNQTGSLKLKFFAAPPSDCDWKLLKDVRKSAASLDDVNTQIRRELSLITDNPDAAYPDNYFAWIKFLKVYKVLSSMVTYRPVFEDSFYQALQEFYDDNILYLELRASLSTLYDLNGTEYGQMDVMKIYQEAADRFKRDHPHFFGVKVIFSLSAIKNIASPRKIEESISKAIEMKSEFPEFFAGLDMDGYEDRRMPLKNFVEQLTKINSEIKFFFHAGETNWNGFVSDENVLDAVLLNTSRIGHGLAILKHPEILRLAKEKNIPLEMCPVSNQVLKLTPDLRNHPASMLFAENYPVVISNDDSGLWGSKGLSYDFYEAFMGIMPRGADLRALKQLAINSIIYSAMDDHKKQRALGIWFEKWAEFIGKVKNLRDL